VLILVVYTNCIMCKHPYNNYIDLKLAALQSRPQKAKQQISSPKPQMVSKMLPSDPAAIARERPARGPLKPPMPDARPSRNDGRSGRRPPACTATTPVHHLPCHRRAGLRASRLASLRSTVEPIESSATAGPNGKAVLPSAP
jgi:hypothetical protein